MGVDHVQASRLSHDRFERPLAFTAQVRLRQSLHAEKSEFFVHGASHHDARGAGRLLADNAGEGREHSRHAGLHVTGAAAVKAAVFDAGAERVDGHAVGRHRVLMHFEDEGALRVGRLVPGEDVVALRGRRLSFPADAEAAEEIFEKGGNAAFEEVWPGEIAAHRVDAGQRHEVAQQARSFIHGTPEEFNRRIVRQGYYYGFGLRRRYLRIEVPTGRLRELA